MTVEERKRVTADTTIDVQSSERDGCIHDDILIVSNTDFYDQNDNNVSYPAMQMGLRS